MPSKNKKTIFDNRPIDCKCECKSKSKCRTCEIINNRLESGNLTINEAQDECFQAPNNCEWLCDKRSFAKQVADSGVMGVSQKPSIEAYEKGFNWFVDMKGEPLSKTYLRYKNSSREKRKAEISRKKAEILKSISSVSKSIRSIVPGIRPIYKSYKLNVGIYLAVTLL